MEKKETLKIRLYYDCNELDTLAKVLEKKAAAGWKLISVMGAVWRFEKCEPRKVQFNVELIDRIAGDKDRKEFIAYCEAAGWKHVYSEGELQIFEHGDLDAEPIHTDQAVKLKLVHKKGIKNRIIIPCVVMTLLTVFYWKTTFPLSVYQMESYNNLFFLTLVPLADLCMLIYALQYLLWYRKAKSAVDFGGKPVYRKSKISKFVDMFAVLLAPVYFCTAILLDAIHGGDRGACYFVLFLLIISGLLLLAPFSKLDYHRKQGRRTKIGFLMILILPLGVLISTLLFPSVWENTKIPLSLADLDMVESTYEENSGYRRGTFLLDRFEGWDSAEDDKGKEIELDYTIYTTKFDKIYQMAVEHELVPEEGAEEFFETMEEFEAAYNYKEVLEPAFDANKVYYNEDLKSWLLLYDNRIVELREPQSLNDEQKAIIGEKINV